MIKNPEIKFFIDGTKKEIENLYKGPHTPLKHRNQTELFVLSESGESKTKINVLRALIGMSKNLATSKTEFNKKAVLHLLAEIPQTDKVLCVAWYKLVKQVTKNEAGEEQISKRGVCMIFESIEGTEVFCKEIIYESDDLGKNDCVIEFGEEIKLTNTSSFDHSFQILLNFNSSKELSPQTQINKYTFNAEEFKDFLTKKTGEFKVLDKRNSVDLSFLCRN